MKMDVLEALKTKLEKKYIYDAKEGATALLGGQARLWRGWGAGPTKATLYAACFADESPYGELLAPVRETPGFTFIAAGEDYPLHSTIGQVSKVLDNAMNMAMLGVLTDLLPDDSVIEYDSCHVTPGEVLIAGRCITPQVWRARQNWKGSSKALAGGVGPIDYELIHISALRFMQVGDMAQCEGLLARVAGVHAKLRQTPLKMHVKRTFIGPTIKLLTAMKSEEELLARLSVAAA